VSIGEHSSESKAAAAHGLRVVGDKTTAISLRQEATLKRHRNPLPGSMATTSSRSYMAAHNVKLYTIRTARDNLARGVHAHGHL